jgi:hypothetical protein
MKAYYTPNHGFIYIVINDKDAIDIKLINDFYIKDYFNEFDTNKEVHLTTDCSWDLYFEKRLREPSLVRIYQTQAELNEDLEILGFSL